MEAGGLWRRDSRTAGEGKCAGFAQRLGSSWSGRIVTADAGPSTDWRHQACRLAESAAAEAAVSNAVDLGNSPWEEVLDALVAQDWEWAEQAGNSSLSAGRRSREDIDGPGLDS